MGPRLGRVEYKRFDEGEYSNDEASMGPRLGRVEYSTVGFPTIDHLALLQWGHA